MSRKTWKLSESENSVIELNAANASVWRSAYSHDKLRKIIEAFDSTYYVNRYPDVKNSEFDPLDHYINCGVFEHRNPRPDFITDDYLLLYGHILTKRDNPFVHWALIGRSAGLYASGLPFAREMLPSNEHLNLLYENLDCDFYKERYDDVNRSCIDPVIHYCVWGWREGRDPRADFSTTFYLDQYRDVRDAGINPFLHYLLSGLQEGRMPTVSAKKATHRSDVKGLIIVTDSKVSAELNDIATIPDVGPIVTPSFEVMESEAPDSSVISGVVDAIQPAAYETSDGSTVDAGSQESQDSEPNSTIASVANATNDASQLDDATNHSNFIDPYVYTTIAENFDHNFYLSQIPPNEPMPDDPVLHYIRIGIHDLLDPSPSFSTIFYLESNPDVRKDGINPFFHYLAQGRNEGRLPQDNSDSSRQKSLIPPDVYSCHSFYTAPGPAYEKYDSWVRAAYQPRVKAIAYYLPQFHAIAENDKWWGEGFTEWRNTSRALPRFEGHYQPRIPRDLGFYNLEDINVLRHQCALAKSSGIYAFAFYYYYFNKKRVLDRPVELFLADESIDMPFLLVWANENWTKTWDGFDRDVLLRQDYRLEDDVHFVSDLARHFMDKRYLRIGDRPLWVIYRPGIIPNAKETFNRWRGLFWELFKLDPIIMMAQGFDDLDPRVYELDGAVEFPPHKVASGLAPINHKLNIFDGSFRGHVLSYDDMVRQSLAENPSDFPLIRAVTPSWDNEARRPGRGMTLHGSTPGKFESWLRAISKQALENSIGGESFVLINAWNEWAEGAYLEPDIHYGFAYLNATFRGVSLCPEKADTEKLKVLIVGHDAEQNGAQFLALGLGARMTRQFGVNVAYLLLGGGPLLPQYNEIGPTTILSANDPDLHRELERLRLEGYSIAVTNTAATGNIIPALKHAGFKVASLVHELRRVIISYSFTEHCEKMAAFADYIVFPSEVVEASFFEIVDNIKGQALILPQGLYKEELLDLSLDRASIRAELGLPLSAQVVIGVGYADLRKGIDRFISTALSICANNKDIYFIWVGSPSREAIDWHLPDIDRAKLNEQIRITGFESNVARWYAIADLFFLTSREDPFPSVVLEAMAVGLPIVGYYGTGGCDSIVERYGRLVSECDSLNVQLTILQFLGQSKAEKEISSAERRAAVIRDYNFNYYCFSLLQKLREALPTVSVIVPNYNYAHYIGDRLRTIFQQTHPVFEIIVLDDASPDNSVEEVTRVAIEEKRDIRLYVNEINSGSPFPQWRKGLSLANGKYIWIAEADDLSVPDFLGLIIARMQVANSAIGFCDSKQIDELGRHIGASYKPYINQIEDSFFDTSFDISGPEFLARFLSVKNVILNVSGVVFRRDALKMALETIGDELDAFRVAGDWRIYAEICSAGGGVSYLADSLNTHRRHSVSVTHSLNVDKHLSEIKYMHRFAAERVMLSSSAIAQQAEHLAASAAHLLKTE